jgi:hypothetical protein
MNLFTIKVYVKKETSPEAPVEKIKEGDPTVIECEDQTFPKGGVGFFTNCAINARFDLIESEPIPCTLPEPISP